MINENNIKFLIKKYRDPDKMKKIKVYENERYYQSRIILYKAAVTDFDNIKDFYANIDRDHEKDPKAEWSPITGEDWADVQDKQDESFGPRSTYDKLEWELKKNRVAKSKHFVEGYQLWTDWDSGSGDLDKLTLAWVALIKKTYVFFVFEGFVIH